MLPLMSMEFAEALRPPVRSPFNKLLVRSAFKWGTHAMVHPEHEPLPYQPCQMQQICPADCSGRLLSWIWIDCARRVLPFHGPQYPVGSDTQQASSTTEFSSDWADYLEVIKERKHFLALYPWQFDILCEWEKERLLKLCQVILLFPEVHTPVSDSTEEGQIIEQVNTRSYEVSHVDSTCFSRRQTGNIEE